MAYAGELILPTGGTYRDNKVHDTADEAWLEFHKSLQEDLGLTITYHRGSHTALNNHMVVVGNVRVFSTIEATE